MSREDLQSPASSLRPSLDSNRSSVAHLSGNGIHLHHNGSQVGSFLDVISRTGTPSHRRRSSSISLSSAGPWSDLSGMPIGLNRGDLLHGTLGANSIAEIVGNPRQSSTFKTPSTREIPPVTLSKIKKVSRLELQTYLKEITEEYESFYNNSLRASSSSGLSSMFSDVASGQTSLSNFSAALENIDNNNNNNIETSNNSSNSSTENVNSTPQPELTPLSTIPSVFFETDFQLDNPRIFDLVSEKSSLIRPEDQNDQQQQQQIPKHKVLASNLILQEKLSWYIDTVELHLIQEISNASSTFFSALDDLRSINTQASDVIAKIERLRRDLAAIDRQRAVLGIENLKLKQRRRNLSILLQSLTQLEVIMDKADAAETLYIDSDFDSCLDMLDDVEALIAGTVTEGNKPWVEGWQFSLCDVRSVEGLHDLRASLRVLRTRVGEGFSRRFTDLLVRDLHAHIESVSKPDTLHRMGKILDRTDTRPVNNSYLELDKDLRKTLEAIVQGLLRSNDIQGAFKQYRDIIIKEAKNVVRHHLPSSSASGNSDTMSMSSNMTGRSSNSTEKSVSLAGQLRNLSGSEFEDMLSSIYTNLSELFRRLSTQQKLLLDVTLSASSTLEYSTIDLSDLMNQVIESSQNRIVKIINVRRDVNATKLDSQNVINFYSLTGIFLSECEAICGEPGSALRSSVTGQIKQFLTNRHRDRSNTLMYNMDKAQWREEEISSEFQKLVDNIVLSAEKDPTEWTNKLKQVLTNYSEDKSTNANATDASKKKSDKLLPKNVFVGTESFIIPSSAVEVIRELQDYEILMLVLPHLGITDIIPQLIDLVRKFNTKTNSLILGAGATRTAAGLRHITAKHLALAAQAVNITAALLGQYVHACVRRHYGAANLVVVNDDLDKLDGELKTHVEEIYNKFVTLMSDKMNHHVDAILHKVDWLRAPPAEGSSGHIEGAGNAGQVIYDTVSGLYKVEEIFNADDIHDPAPKEEKEKEIKEEKKPKELEPAGSKELDPAQDEKKPESGSKVDDPAGSNSESDAKDPKANLESTNSEPTEVVNKSIDQAQSVDVDDKSELDTTSPDADAKVDSRSSGSSDKPPFAGDDERHGDDKTA
ncbi:hypothetical protein D0Z00_004321 [Geotrichum galactomycetum]|uniref:Uncharacterized protein n=1 Tax=Geotrichum galactomycetum TaxID=27317 RepID=A0ACB6UYW8_9ASCO|nr:hypothetical protein D0Z00_004321 [Geotrichum candidum]